MIGPVQSHYHEAVQTQPVEVYFRWEGFVEKIGFQPGVKK